MPPGGAQPLGLNPLAVEFVPGQRHRQLPVDLEYTGWGLGGRQSRHVPLPRLSAHPPGDAEGADWSDVPKEVVAAILARLEDPADLLAVALACRGTLHAAAEAPLRLRLPPAWPQPRCTALLQAAPSLFEGVRELLLAGAAVEDGPLVAALPHLPRLAVLDVSGCRKLSPAFPRLALRAAGEGSQAAPGLPGRGLAAIGLQRCFQLRAAALSDVLAAAGAAGARLQAATLSHLKLAAWPACGPPELPAPPQPGLPAARRVPCGCLRVLALHNCGELAPEGIAFLAAACPELEALLLGGTRLALAPAATESFAEHCGRRAAALAEPCLGLAKLRTLELTFHEAAADVAARLPGVQVWDFTQSDSLAAAEAALEAARRTPQGPGLALALAAAANCSTPGRVTPLHSAVANDCPACIPALLRLRAQLEAKDHSGATPLFRACESGRLACARLLLAAGAEPRTTNSGGEAPLYIAALRGHGETLQALLAAFAWRGLKWTESELYGDQWNPLMAAAVADRHAIALQLLRAAGPEAASLALATNRYGQCAAHIAARKGSHALLHALLAAAGNVLATIPDNEHNTPLEIARAHRQELAARLLGQAHAASAQETAQAQPQGVAGRQGGARRGGRRR